MLSSMMGKLDLATYIAISGINVKLSPVKCWWNNEVTKCENEFESCTIDGFRCFVFNQNSSVIAGGNVTFRGNTLTDSYKIIVSNL